MAGVKTPGHGFSLLAENNIFGLASLLDMSDRVRCIQTLNLPEFVQTLIEVTCENSTGREYVPAILPDQVDFTMDIDLYVTNKAGGTDNFKLFLPPAYKADQAGVQDVSEALETNTYVWEYTAVASSIGGGVLEAGSTDITSTTINKTLSGENFVRQTFDPVAGDSTLGFVLADGTDPATEPGGTVDDRIMYVIQDGSYDFGGGAQALTAGQKLTYDIGVTNTWLVSATWP